MNDELDYKTNPRCHVCKMPTKFIDDGERLPQVFASPHKAMGVVNAAGRKRGVYHCEADNMFLLMTGESEKMVSLVDFEMMLMSPAPLPQEEDSDVKKEPERKEEKEEPESAVPDVQPGLQKDKDGYDYHVPEP